LASLWAHIRALACGCVGALVTENDQWSNHNVKDYKATAKKAILSARYQRYRVGNLESPLATR
jgi:hypothetical protein